MPKSRASPQKRCLGLRDGVRQARQARRGAEPGGHADGAALHAPVQTVSDGRKLILEANPVFDAQGKLVLCITFLRDVTMLSEMREQMSVPEGAARSVPAAQYRRGRTGAFPQDAEAVHQQCHDQALRRGEHYCGDGRHVLLLGETGVGKDVIARRIHALSLRKNKTFTRWTAEASRKSY